MLSKPDSVCHTPGETRSEPEGQSGGTTVPRRPIRHFSPDPMVAGNDESELAVVANPGPTLLRQNVV